MFNKPQREIDHTQMLAQLIASEGLQAFHNPKATTAYFDLKNRLLALPVWKHMDRDLETMLIGHECSHALHTKLHDFKHFRKWCEENKIPRGLYYVLEDHRIDGLIKSRYPGIRTHYYKGAAALIDGKFFGNMLDDLSKASFGDRVNIWSKIGVVTDVPFNEKEQKFVDKLASLRAVNQLKPLLKEFANLCNEDPNNSHDQPDEKNSDGAGEKSEGKDGFNEIDSTQHGIEDDSLKSQKVMDEAISEHADDRATVAKLSLYDIKKEDLCYKQKGYTLSDDTRAKMKSLDTYKTIQSLRKKVVSVYISEFNRYQSANEYRRTQETKLGQIDMTRIASYKFNDNLFLRGQFVPDGKNHGMAIIIDFSGSMHHNLKSTLTQAIIAADFCRRVKIPFKVFTFTDVVPPNRGANAHAAIRDKEAKNQNNNHILCSAVNVIEFLNSDQKTSEYNYAVDILLATALSCSREFGYYTNSRFSSKDVLPRTGSTPIPSTLQILRGYIGDFIQANNVEKMTTMFLTDGDSTERVLFTKGVYGYNDSDILVIEDENKDIHRTRVRDVRNHDISIWADIYSKHLAKFCEHYMIGFFLSSCASSSFGEHQAKKSFGNMKEFDIPGFDSFFTAPVTIVDGDSIDDYMCKKGLTKEDMTVAKVFRAHKATTGKAVASLSMFVRPFMRIIA